MKECEVKILHIDRQVVEHKLQELGASRVFSGPIHARFYDYPDLRLRKLKKTIRLRSLGSRVFLTYKGHVSHNDASVKIKDESEVEVLDFGIMDRILESIGLEVWHLMEKVRTSYRLGEVHFEFDKHTDQFSFVPEYLEIEAPDTKTLYQAVRKLGFTQEMCRPWTIFDIVEHEYPDYRVKNPQKVKE